MSSITLQPQLMEQLEKIASERDVRPGELVESALRTYLRQLDREKIKAEVAAFQAMHTELAEQYMGEYVAIHDGGVVDHDRDFRALHSRVRQRFGRQAVLLRRVEAGPDREWTFRSPRFERGDP